jgi:glycerol uptake facilitator-like aquaporin
MGIALIYFVCLMLFGRISGGHFNPVITIILVIEESITKKKALYYILP